MPSGMRGSTAREGRPRGDLASRRSQRGNSASNGGPTELGHESDGHGDLVEFVRVERGDQTTEEVVGRQWSFGSMLRGSRREEGGLLQVMVTQPFGDALGDIGVRRFVAGDTRLGISSDPGGAVPGGTSTNLMGSLIETYLAEESGRGLRNAVQNARLKCFREGSM